MYRSPWLAWSLVSKVYMVIGIGVSKVSLVKNLNYSFIDEIGCICNVKKQKISKTGKSCFFH